MDARKDEIDVALQQFNPTKTQERRDADVFVVKDAAAMPERARLFAGGLGLTVIDAALVEGGQGFKLKFRRACQTPRRIYFTAGCKAKHDDFAQNVRSLLNQHTKISKWKLATDKPQRTNYKASTYTN